MAENELMFSADKNFQKHKTVIDCKTNFIPPIFKKCSVYCFTLYLMKTMTDTSWFDIRIIQSNGGVPYNFFGYPIISNDNHLL